MTNEEFKRYADEILARVSLNLQSKGKEYAEQHDRLSNFRKAAQLENTTPEVALYGMQVKHLVSISDLITDIRDHSTYAPDPVWLEKLGDEITYSILLYAMLRGRYLRNREKEKEALKEYCASAKEIKERTKKC